MNEFDTDAICNLEIRWREPNSAEHVKEVYKTLLKTSGISRVDYDFKQEKRG